MPNFSTQLTIPSSVKEITLELTEGATTLQYAKIVVPSIGSDVACTDTQEFRVLPYRDEEQFIAGEPIGGLGFQLINCAHRCTQDPNRIILTHDCAHPALSDDNGESWYRLGRDEKGLGFYLDRPQAIISAVDDDSRLVGFGTSYFSTNTSFASYLPGFYLSTDAGTTWTQTHQWQHIDSENTHSGMVEFGYTRTQEHVLVNDPSTPANWYCGTEKLTTPSDFNTIDSTKRALHYSSDGATSWTTRIVSDADITDSGGINSDPFGWWHSLVMHPSDGSLYACTDKGLYRNTDPGDVTEASKFIKIDIDTNHPTMEVSHLVFANASVLYACGREYTDIGWVNGDPVPQDGVYGTEWWGLYKSTDGGFSWTLIADCARNALSSNLATSTVTSSVFSSDVGTSTLFTPWRLELTPGNTDLYIIGGPNTWTWNVWLIKNIDSVTSSANLTSTSADYITNLSGNARMFVLCGPTIADRFDAFAGCSGHGFPWKALKAAELTSEGYDPVADLGYIFAVKKTGWKGENIYSWYRANHDPNILMYGNADVNMYASFNNGNYVVQRTAESPATRGGVNHVNAMIYARPSTQRVVASMGGPNNSHLAYFDSFNNDAQWSATMAYFPGIRPSDLIASLTPEQQATYDSQFPNESQSTDSIGTNPRLYYRMYRNPDNLDWIISADSVTYDGGLTWDYIPGLTRGEAGTNEGSLSAEILSVVWQANGEHVVWAVCSTRRGSTSELFSTVAYSCLMRTTWSVASGFGTWEKLPNVFGITEGSTPHIDLDTTQRVNFAGVGGLCIAQHPTDPNIIYALVVDGTYTISPTNGDLWKFDYTQKNDSTSAQGQGLGGWTKISSAKSFAQTFADTSCLQADGITPINVHMTQIIVDSNPGFANDILYVVFGTPGCISVIRSTDGGSNWVNTGSKIPCSSTIRAFLEPSTGELITSACDGCYIHPAPLGYLRDPNITPLWSISAALPVDSAV